MTSTEQRMYSANEVAKLVRDNLIGWGLVALFVCVVPTVLLVTAIPKFESLFRGFGADLPDSTMFLLHWRHLLWILPAVALLLLGFTLSTAPETAIAWHRRIVAAFAVLCCGTLIVGALAVVALYAPIFKLGAAV